MPRKIEISTSCVKHAEPCVDSEAEKKTPCVKHAEPCVSSEAVSSLAPPIHTDVKPKRQITDAQREHLNKIRELAMQKKKELKEITLKSKLAKTVPKQELAAQYDNYIAQKATQKPKPHVDPEPESESEEEVIVKKSKQQKQKKKVKKIVYESDSEDEVIVRKKKPLEKLVYDNTKDQLYHRMIEERVKNSIIGYGNSLGV